METNNENQMSDVKKIGYKRSGYISWDQYFMGIALLSAERSKDPSTQVGACIVGADNRILSVGYNGMMMICPGEETDQHLRANISSYVMQSLMQSLIIVDRIISREQRFM